MENKKQLQEHLKVLQDKLAELVAKRAEMNKGDKTAAKYRQFGDELINVDPAMAGKYYSMADQLDANSEANQLSKYKVDNNKSGSELYKVQSAINAARRAHAMYISKDETDNAAEVKRFIKAAQMEQRSENPSLKRAYINSETTETMKNAIDRAAGMSDDDVDAETDGAGDIQSTATDWDYDSWVGEAFNDAFSNNPDLNKAGGYKNKTNIISTMKTAMRGVAPKGSTDQYEKMIENKVSIKEQESKDNVSADKDEESRLLQLGRDRDNLKAQKLDNTIKRTIGNNADSVKEKVAASVRKMKTAMGSENTYMGMKGALGDAISGGDYAGMANFKGFEGIKAKFNEFVGNNPMTEDKAKEVLESFVRGVNSKVSAYNSNIKSKLGSEPLAKEAYNRLSVPLLQLKQIKSSKSNETKQPGKVVETRNYNGVPYDRYEGTTKFIERK